VTLRISAADGYFQENGRFSMLPSDKESVDAGLWIEVQDEVTVGAGETVIVPFTTTVPENATPGDHAAGIAASVLSQQVEEDGAMAGVESRVGFRVMTPCDWRAGARRVGRGGGVFVRAVVESVRARRGIGVVRGREHR
jgi:hypothetical protein